MPQSHPATVDPAAIVRPARRPPSLVLRVTLLFSMIAVIVFTGFGWFIERSIERHFILEDTAELDVIATAVSRVIATHATTAGNMALDERFNDLLVGHHAAALYVTGPDGRTLFASTNGPDLSTMTKRANNSLSDWAETDRAYRVLTRYVQSVSTEHKDGDSYTIAVAVSIDHHRRFLDRFRHTLWLMVASAIVIMGLMGWAAVHQGHAPLYDIIAQIRHTSAAELNTRLTPETVPAELFDLAVAFNDMLERMEASFQRLSNFSADIAHELRTPVTNLLTQTQVALSKSRSEDEYREILYSNMEEYERMAQMVSDMLFLAKTDNGLYQPDTVAVDLGQEVLDLFEFYEAWADERGVSLALAGKATVPGDRLMLRRALGNLLSNAIIHTAPGHSVRVSLNQIATSSVSISVENPGPAIPERHLPRLFDRFYRVDASRQRGGDGGGLGLGLAIVKSIIDIHGGKIEVMSIAGCTRFQITLPTAAKPVTNRTD